MNTVKKSTGGYWVLLGLFVLLAAPIALDHVFHFSAQAPAPEVHAEANTKSAN